MLNQLRNNKKCFICDKALYEESNKNIELVIPTGLERNDDKEQLCSLEKCSSQNINKFRNEFKSKKIINVKTINIMDLFQKIILNILIFFHWILEVMN